MCLGIPGRLESISESLEGASLAKSGSVSFEGIRREVHLAFVPEAKVGDFLIVHVGVAISILDENEARRTLEYLRGMDCNGVENHEVP